jgi:hypothetical protein
MNETIEVTSTELRLRKPVQVGAAFHRKLEILAEENRPRTSMTALVEYWIQQEWQRTHAQPQTIEEETERR